MCKSSSEPKLIIGQATARMQKSSSQPSVAIGGVTTHMRRRSSEPSVAIGGVTTHMRRRSSEPSVEIGQAIAHMRRRSSKPNVEIERTTTHMRKSSSEPNVIIGQAPAQHPLRPGEMRGGVLLKGTPDAEKAMRVDFKSSPSTLEIILIQERDGVVHDFLLFTLDLATLFVGWDSKNQDVFVLGAQHQDKVFHPIYCYPCRFRRNRWLRFFEDNGCMVTSMVRTSACENGGFHVLSPIREGLSSSGLSSSVL
jgi:hypothetical protein